MEYKFVFQAVPEQEELFRQVSQGLEKLTEMYSREKLPGLWKVTDRLNRAQEGKAPISSGRRNFRRVMALVDWLLGIFALIPAVQSPKELGTLLAVGAAAFGVLSLLEHRHDLSAVVQPMTHAPFVLAILFLSVVASVLSYLALNRALEVLPVARTAALINFSTVVSVLAGVLILREPFGWVSAAASAAILVGIWGVQRFAAPALPDADKRTEPLPPS